MGFVFLRLSFPWFPSASGAAAASASGVARTSFLILFSSHFHILRRLTATSRKLYTITHRQFTDVVSSFFPPVPRQAPANTRLHIFSPALFSLLPGLASATEYKLFRLISAARQKPSHFKLIVNQIYILSAIPQHRQSHKHSTQCSSGRQQALHQSE